ncbi:response regulator [Pedobacter miscanthi]|uniref:Response regulator n=1 Tax=Pedobacter miscanthi TaxID=2259170 RepID=A0A366LFC4_9SPHI|nr:response regulator [Pedobacter miscanthi]RBQ11842.1 response regulator [Pedobacter miscanthi]
MGKKVIIFEDDMDLALIFSFLFEEERWDVKTFENCDCAVGICKEYSPDLILMDNWIPTIGGKEAIRQLKGDPQLKNIPVILVSANNNIKEVFANSGADAYLAKPFDLEDLLVLARQLIQIKVCQTDLLLQLSHHEIP